MVSVGIDVSKGKSTVCALKPYGEVVISPHGIEHTEESLSAFAANVLSFGEETTVVMEATGAYHLPVLMYLQQMGIHTCVINPLVMKKYANRSIRKAKTDKLDSVRIASYGLDHWFSMMEFQPPAASYEELRLLGRQYAHYIDIKVSCQLGLTHLLDRRMPGIKTLLRGSRPDYAHKNKLCDFVERFWHYDNITVMDEAEFVAAYLGWAKENKYHANERKAKTIYRHATISLPTLHAGRPSTKLLVLEAVRMLRETVRALDAVLTQMQAIAGALPEFEVVRDMPGVGDVLAARLIAEIGDARRFHSGSALIAFAGIDSPPFESGTFVGNKRRISKRGSWLLRKTGFEAMTSIKAVKPTRDTAVYDYMLKKESEGKSKKTAKIAALNKFLRIYYARVKEVYAAGCATQACFFSLP